ncbi:MAG: IS110 family transposase [Candidatus Aminicenantia bacterium]
MKKQLTKNVEKRKRIKERTLIIGLDIGSKFNAMALTRKDGTVLATYPKIYNSRKGFEYYMRLTKEQIKRHGFRDVLVGFEPTGHYWRKIAYFSKEQGFEVRFVRTTALKHQRELDESSSGKGDVRDALTIANIVREGKYLDTVIEDNIFRQLRTLGKVRERIRRYNTGTKHALKAVLDDYFPELNGIFWSMKAKGLWVILEKYPFPEDILKQDIFTISEDIAKSSRRRAKAVEKAQKVYEAAKSSVGLAEISSADRYKVKMYLDELKRSEAQLKEIETEMMKLVMQVPCVRYLLSIPGIGKLSAAVFLGELGAPGNFSDYRKIVKYSGYDPVENDSGLWIGRKIISKKGRYLLRKFLYYMSMRVIVRSEYFRSYYERKLSSKNRFGQTLRKKEAFPPAGRAGCAVTIKLVKVIFSLLRDEREFQEEAVELRLTA